MVLSGFGDRFRDSRAFGEYFWKNAGLLCAAGLSKLLIKG
jgi:hypothetical protein